MPRFFLYGLIAAGISLVFFFSWIPQPRLELTALLPDWLSRWADQDENMNLRTAIPLLFLGLVTGIWLVVTRQPLRSWGIAWLGLVGVVGLAEAGQLLQPLRHFDWGDIGWGAAGSAAGLLVEGSFGRLLVTHR
ncbi:hypothetical protein [Spirosoma rhododendri]|uniref:VanZ family protein n=1 Tax=Spirosoma rhododendri TaxID=2728024 RepID=A0A7L5DX64_9BACT|nr:hypothetical protein [Spirosoma rhododendri]QJD80130.1 hypothetical protein HH216_18220 [Spirosoma rhododendri]